MARFLAPAVEAAVVTVAAKIVKSKELKKEKRKPFKFRKRRV